MAHRNRVFILGHLGGDAEKHVFPDATKFRFRVATTKKWKDRTTGQLSEATQWHAIDWRVTNPTQIAYFERELIGGALADVEGELEYRNFDDSKGVNRTVAEIRADRVQVLPSAAQLAARAAREASATPPPAAPVAPVAPPLEPDTVVFV